MAKSKVSPTKTSYRYGIGEWYGNSFVHLALKERKLFGQIQSLDKKKRPPLPCPFRSTADNQVRCTKEGGVCSIRLYQQEGDSGLVSVARGVRGSLVTTCPYRFQQGRRIIRWIGETLLNHPEPVVVGEVGFLEKEAGERLEGNAELPAEDVGRIDNVLVHPTAEPLLWCALEIQAVYFSGAAMSKEFKMLRRFSGESLPFPVGHRRPDYRSSGPKRLMPQLQIKVPTLRRWGKRMAVVVDRSFFGALGKMEEVKDISNCDIAWFVVKYDETDAGFVLEPDSVRLTTLESAVEGLTGGRPVNLQTFEARIQEKLVEKRREIEASPGPSQ